MCAEFFFSFLLCINWFMNGRECHSIFRYIQWIFHNMHKIIGKSTSITTQFNKFKSSLTTQHTIKEHVIWDRKSLENIPLLLVSVHPYLSFVLKIKLSSLHDEISRKEMSIGHLNLSNLCLDYMQTLNYKQNGKKRKNSQ